MLKTDAPCKGKLGNEALAQSLFHAGQGRKIIRLKPDGKIPAEVGWQSKGTSDENLIKDMFNQFPGMNYGIVTGSASNLLVLDLDEKKGVSGTAALVSKLGGDSKFTTYRVSTPSGGSHYYFLDNGQELTNKTALLPGVDFRGKGGYIVGPGSSIGGVQYLGDKDYETAPLPQKLLELITHKKNVVHLSAKSPLDGVAEGGRDDAIFKYSLHLKKLGLTWNESIKLVSAKAANCTPPFPENEALKCLNSAWKYESTSVVPKPYDGAGLLEKDIPEPDWIVEGILPVGLTILAGKPKSGKSWLALDLSTSLATGIELFESHPVIHGRATVLALEDTPHRLKARMVALHTKALKKGDVQFYTEWPSADTDLLEQAITSMTGTKLVVIDTLARFRQKAKANSDLYGRDYEDISRIKQVADRNQVAILVLHHLRKAKSDDPFEMINGTGGINGAADTLWVLDRSPSAPSASLHIRGRDVEDQVLSLQFDAGRWKNLGLFEHKPNSTELQYLSHLQGKALSPKELAALTGHDVATVSKRLQRMVEKLMIVKQGHGLYVSQAYQL